MTTHITRIGSIVQARPTLGYTFVMLGVALALSFGTASQASAAKLACKPDIKVKNEKPWAIKVLSIDYKHDNGEIDTEGLANKKLSRNETEEWKNQKLQHVAAGNPITGIRVEYRDNTSGQGKPRDPWGAARKTVFYGQSGDCTNSTTYTIEK
ncbi:MAG: hypothetical protein OEY60_14615 [Nitrospira sp.]|nr:hypothetical protein [Nitrospira sp.]MDH5499368.1 hypothetical protein [Nitrospira sp.]MDH5726695.1 hypothetical protein [Nitrospira sp.]